LPVPELAGPQYPPAPNGVKARAIALFSGCGGEDLRQKLPLLARRTARFHRGCKVLEDVYTDLRSAASSLLTSTCASLSTVDAGSSEWAARSAEFQVPHLERERCPLVAAPDQWRGREQVTWCLIRPA